MDRLDVHICTLVSLLVKTHKPLDPEEARNQPKCLNRASYLLKNKYQINNVKYSGFKMSSLCWLVTYFI